jgi:hypothetical protein
MSIPVDDKARGIGHNNARKRFYVTPTRGSGFDVIFGAERSAGFCFRKRNPRFEYQGLRRDLVVVSKPGNIVLGPKLSGEGDV